MQCISVQNVAHLMKSIVSITKEVNQKQFYNFFATLKLFSTKALTTDTNKIGKILYSYAHYLSIC